MVAFRTSLIVATLLFFLIAVTPLQMLMVRLNLRQSGLAQIALCRALLFLLRVKVNTTGDARPGQARLVLANHVSWIDILVFGSIEPICFLAKREVSRWPIISSFAKAQRTVFVDRTRRRSIPGANRAMAERMQENRSVIVFPEATTHDGTALGKFHSSHVAAARELLHADQARHEVLVQPAAIFYSSAHAAWTGDASLLPHLFEVLRKPPLQANVVLGAALAFEKTSDRKIVCATAKEQVAALLAAHRAAVEITRISEVEDAIGFPSFETRLRRSSG